MATELGIRNAEFGMQTFLFQLFLLIKLFFLKEKFGVPS
jgi:hypothetical protein